MVRHGDQGETLWGKKTNIFVVFLEIKKSGVLTGSKNSPDKISAKSRAVFLLGIPKKFGIICTHTHIYIYIHIGAYIIKA